MAMNGIHILLLVLLRTLIAAFPGAKRRRSGGSNKVGCQVGLGQNSVLETTTVHINIIYWIRSYHIISYYIISYHIIWFHMCICNIRIDTYWTVLRSIDKYLSKLTSKPFTIIYIFQSLLIQQYTLPIVDQCSRSETHSFGSEFSWVKAMELADRDRNNEWFDCARSCLSDSKWEMAANRPESSLSHRTCPWGGHLIRFDNRPGGIRLDANQTSQEHVYSNSVCFQWNVTVFGEHHWNRTKITQWRSEDFCKPSSASWSLGPA